MVRRSFVTITYEKKIVGKEKIMFSKNNKFWFRNIVVLATVSLVLAVFPSIADIIYSEHTQATLDGIISDTQVTAASAPDTRTTIGIGEKVDCAIDANTWEDKDCKKVDDGPWTDVNDTIGDKTWSAIGSGGTVSPTSGDKTVLTAKKTPAGVTVEVTVYDSNSQYVDAPVIKTKPFSVIAPNGQTYSKDSDCPDPCWNNWENGTKYMAARTYFNATVQPTTVSFVKAEFREHFPGETSTWPNGDTFYHSTGSPPFEINASNQWDPDDRHFTGGLFSINKLYTGSEWQDFKPENDIPLQYKNESGTWKTFYTATGKAEFYYATGKARATVDGHEGGLQGPWQAP